MVRFHPHSPVEEVKQQENKQESKGEKWYRPVMFFYVKTTSWIVIPLVLAVLLGKFASRSTGNGILFFVALIIGFGVTVYGIYKEIVQYKKTLTKEKDGGK